MPPFFEHLEGGAAACIAQREQLLIALIEQGRCVRSGQLVPKPPPGYRGLEMGCPKRTHTHRGLMR
jgi:hypothetical protein